MARQKTLITAEQLLRMRDDGQAYELLDGVLVEMSPPGGRHGAVGGNAYFLLRGYLDAQDLGTVLPEIGVLLARYPDRVRAPDVCVLLGKHVSAADFPYGYLEHVPEFIIEVASPNDRPAEIRRKVDEWLRSGARLVWLIDPAERTIFAYRSDEPVRIYREGDSVDGAPVLPDFRVAVAAFFA
jgi:Uma2 family endonuclease